MIRISRITQIISIFIFTFAAQMQSITNMKKILTALLCLATISTQLLAQSTFTEKLPHKENAFFNKMDVALTAGSTGVGIDFAAPVNNMLRLRAGFTYVPKFKYNMEFPIEIGDSKGGMTQAEKFERLSGMLEQFTGYKVDNKADMVGEPTFCNFKFMVDIFPLQNKRWHLTAGFYWGPSKIAEAVNTTEDMPSLVAIGIYNKLYDKLSPIICDKYNNDLPLFISGETAVYVTEEQYEIMNSGRMGINLGKFKDGSSYRMTPDENSMAKAKMKVNSFRPYLGLGYGSSMMNTDSKYSISFDCGILFWGGVPDVITHDGTNLTKDMKKVYGKVGNYVDIAKKFRVFPVIELRVARRLY